MLHAHKGGMLKLQGAIARARMQPSSKFEPEYLDEVAPALGVGVGLAMRRVDV